MLRAHLGERDRSRPLLLPICRIPSPHWPLQARRRDRGETIAAAIRMAPRRCARSVWPDSRKLGLVPQDAEPHPIIGGRPWSELSDDEKAVSARTMEVLCRHGRAHGLEHRTGDRTVARKRRPRQHLHPVRMSDNGAEERAAEAAPRFGPNLLEFISEHYDNSLDNIGARQRSAMSGTARAGRRRQPRRHGSTRPSPPRAASAPRRSSAIRASACRARSARPSRR